MIGVVGYLCLDLFPDLGKTPFAFEPGALREIGAMPFAPGGTVGNTGGALARLGVPVRLGAATGDDFIGETLHHALSATIDSSAELHLTRYKGMSSGYSIVLNAHGVDRMFLVCRGVNDQIDADTFGKDFRKGLQMIHFGYPPLCRKMAENDGYELKTLFRTCRSENIFTSLDLSLPSPETFSYTLNWRRFLKQVLPETDLFCPSLDEIRFMLKRPDASPDELADEILELGARALLLKLGRDGLLLRTTATSETANRFARFGSGSGWDAVTLRLPALPVPVRDATGAGDSLIAGMLAGIYTGLDASDSAHLARYVAATRIASANAMQGIPRLSEIINRKEWKK